MEVFSFSNNFILLFLSIRKKPKHNQYQRPKPFNTDLDNISHPNSSYTSRQSNSFNQSDPSNSSQSKLIKKNSLSIFSKQRHSRVSIAHISNAEKPIEMGNPQIRAPNYDKQHNVTLQKRRSTINVKRMSKSALEFNSNNKTTNHRPSVTKIPRSQLSMKQPEINFDNTQTKLD